LLGDYTQTESKGEGKKKRGTAALQRNPDTVHAKNFISVRQPSTINSKFVWLASAAWQYVH